MGRKTVGKLSKSLNVRISERELKELQSYCREHDLSYSEYTRRLMITHLGLVDDLIPISGAKIR